MEATIPLGSASRIPRLGLGVFRAGDATRDAVLWALEAGYRHVDTAAIYRNEEDVGRALRESSVPREQVFVTTKLWNDDHGYDASLRAFEESRKRLGVEYIDLYLLHWPVPGLRLESWRALETLHREGRARAIGVSNFTRRHLEELLGVCTIRPFVNQFELHPFLPQPELCAFCREQGIVVAAYSPLTKGRRLDDARLGAVAERAGRSPAQVLLRWGLQKGFVVVAKSANRERIRDNYQALDFELAERDMAELDVLDEGLRTAWDPTDVP